MFSRILAGTVGTVGTGMLLCSAIVVGESFFGPFAFMYTFSGIATLAIGAKCVKYAITG